MPIADSVNNRLLRSGSEKLTTSSRKTYIDFLRIFAILMVIFNHTGTRGFLLFTVERESAFYYLYLCNSIFIRMAVPIFFMISGAMLIPKIESIKVIYKKRVSRFLIVLFFASFISYCYTLGFDLTKIDLLKFLKTLYSSKWATAYWFLYSYLAFLCMLPLIRKFVKSMEFKDYYYLTIMFFL